MLSILRKLLLVVMPVALQFINPCYAAGVPVLIYHEIVDDATEPGETIIHIDRFVEQMAYLASEEYTTLSMPELIEFMEGKRQVPDKSVVLTFDDGWKNVLHAVPVLNQHQYKASFWIITDKGIGVDYMEWPDIQRLATSPRFEVYSHTMTHPWNGTNNLVTWVDGNSPGFGLADARAELVNSKATLEEKISRPVPYLAWPVGWYNDTLIELAKDAGYTALLSAADGANQPGDDVLRIKRIFVDGSCELAQFKQLLKDFRYAPCTQGKWVTRGHLPPAVQTSPSSAK